MTEPTDRDAALATDDADAVHEPRSDLKDALGWVALGVAIVIGSVTMDRLESQHVNPYTVPGLLPGLLGLAMVLLGGLLGVRSVRRGALHRPLPPPDAHLREQRRRIWIVTVLCVTYGAVLVGHGLPFWLASTIFVTGSILVLQRISSDEAERALTPRLWGKALAVGLGSAVITQVVFQELFLVRLP